MTVARLPLVGAETLIVDRLRGHRHGRWGEMKRVLPLLILVAAIVFAFIAALQGREINYLVRTTFGALSLGAIFVGVYTIRRRTSAFDAKKVLGRPQPESPKRSELEMAMLDVSRRYSFHAMQFFFHFLAGDSMPVVRLIEQAHLKGNELQIRTDLTLEVEERYRANRGKSSDAARGSQNGTNGLPKSLLVPLIMTSKGRLLDGLTIRDASGNMVGTLSQYESRGLLAFVVSIMFSLAKAHLSPAIAAQYTDTEEAVMWQLIEEFVCHVGKHCAEDTREELSEAEVRQKLANCINRLPYYFSDVWRNRIERTCTGLLDNYVIVAELPAPENTRYLPVTYSQNVQIERYFAEGNGRRRARFGLAPDEIDATMTRAFEAESYHFQFEANDHQYVYGHHLEFKKSRKVVTQQHLKFGDAQHYARLYHEDARSNAHLYMRRQGRPRSSIAYPEIKTVIKLRETPPGILGGATVVAGINAVVILFFAITQLGLRRSSAPSVDTSISALLLTLPAFIAGVIGNWLEPSRMPGAPLCAYCGLLITMALSFLTTLLYIFDASRVTHTEFQVTFAGGVHWSTNILWLIAAAGALVLASYLLLELRDRSRYYFDILEKRAQNT